MPRIVDHDERRDAVVEATWRVIQRVGVESATLRDIADELGCTTGALTHYFRNKDDLIGFAFEQISERAFATIEKLTAKADPGLPRLAISLERLLPARNSDYPGELVSLSFWGHAATNPKLGEVHRKAYASWRGFVRSFLKEAADLGQLRRDIDIDLEAIALVSLVDGLLVGAVLEPQRFAKNLPKRVLAAAIDRLKAAANEDVRAARS